MAEEISRQPVANPLAALQGRVPGLLITQSSGLSGSAFKVQLRGQNSPLQGSEPFYIIDGVPFAPGNGNINLLENAERLSLFSTCANYQSTVVNVVQMAGADKPTQVTFLVFSKPEFHNTAFF